MAYLVWSTDIEYFLSCEILMDTTNVHILEISHGISFQVYPQTNFLVLQTYTKMHSHQHKIIKLAWILLMHTCSIRTFGIVIVWILQNLSANWWAHFLVKWRNKKIVNFFLFQKKTVVTYQGRERTQTALSYGPVAL